MKKLLITSCLASLSAVSLAAPAQAPANPFNYNYIEGRYIDLSDAEYHQSNSPYYPKSDLDFDGLGINFSLGIADSFSLLGAVSRLDGNIYDPWSKKRLDVDLTILTTGAAYHQALPKISGMPFDLIVRAQIEHVRYGSEKSYYEDDETGILLGGGVQLAIFDKLQAFSELNLSSNDYREVSLMAGARYEFVPNLEAIAAVEVGDIDIFSTGLRYNF